jgi:hypothetical protein
MKLRFEVLTAVKISIFWFAKLCDLVSGHQRFGETLEAQPRKPQSIFTICFMALYQLHTLTYTESSGRATMKDDL